MTRGEILISRRSVDKFLRVFFSRVTSIVIDRDGRRLEFRLGCAR